MTAKIPPYYANSGDGNRCWQACFRMMLEHFDTPPGKTWAWEELDDFTGRKPNMGTWPTKGMLEGNKLGLEVLTIEPFDYAEFAASAEKYWEKTVDPAVLDYYLKHTDIPQEEKFARQFLKAKGIEHIDRPSNNQDVVRILNQGYLIINWVNMAVIAEKEEFSGHFILIYDYDEVTDTFHVHDPNGPKWHEFKPSLPLKGDILTKASFVNDKGDTGGLYAFRPKNAA